MTRTSVPVVSTGGQISATTTNGLIGNDGDHETRVINLEGTVQFIGTAAYTVQAGDINDYILMTAGGSVVIRLPTFASAPLYAASPIFQVTFVAAGATTVLSLSHSGVTSRPYPATAAGTTSGQYAKLILTWVGPNEVHVSGDIV